MTDRVKDRVIDPMTGRDAVIVAARRTPVGRAGGSLAGWTVVDLAAAAIRAAVGDSGIDPKTIDDVILGNAVAAGGNPARHAALAAGLPVSIPGVTVDRQCGSGLEAVIQAAQAIRAGIADVIVVGGAESTSTAPLRAERPRDPGAAPRFYDRPAFAPEAIGDPDMGEAAENVAEAYGVTRQRQDAFALASHQKAVASQRSGRFAREIVPAKLDSGAVVDRDECPRADTSLERLAALRPAFRPDGTVTAGNACPVNDGAAALVMVSAQRWRAMGSPAGLRLVDAAAAGVEPRVLGVGPIPAVRKLLARRPELSITDIALVEFNEAFASQVLACLDALEIPEDRVNAGGGALALGHPYGASGAILVTRLFSELAVGESATGGGLGLATLGIAGGMGLAALFQPVGP